MYLKNLACYLLLSISSLYAVNEKTKIHMLSCYEAFKKEDYAKFETLMKQDKFYIHHLHDEFKDPDTQNIASFYDILTSHLITNAQAINSYAMNNTCSVQEIVNHFNTIFTFQDLLTSLCTEIYESASCPISSVSTPSRLIGSNTGTRIAELD